MSTDEAVKRQSSLVERHEGDESPDGKKDVKYAFAFKNLDWDDYHRHRPVYPESLFKMWFDYHRSHGGEFTEAHDIGAGKPPPEPNPLPSTANPPQDPAPSPPS